jgi:mannose-6-phosphate isomerase-like protein (cupin superfamily)
VEPRSRSGTDRSVVRRRKGAESAVSHRVATIDELDDIAYRQDTHMRPVRHQLGISAFGTNAWTAANQADRLMPEHEEDEGSEELYVVLRGRARFEINGETVDAPERTLVFVPPQVNRTAFAEEPGTTVLAIGSTVGKPYEVRGWEVWAEFHPEYEAGDYDAVIDRAREPLEATGYAVPLYNLACCEALSTRSLTFASPSRGARASVISRRRTPTSTRSGTSRRFASSSASGIAARRVRARTRRCR